MKKKYSAHLQLTQLAGLAATLRDHEQITVLPSRLFRLP